MNATEALTIPLGARLWRCSAGAGIFTIVALDHQDSLRRTLQPQSPESVGPREVMDFKEDAVMPLGEQASGVLLDAPSGVPAVLPRGLARHNGLLLAIEKSDYDLKPAPKQLEILPGWSVAKIATFGAAGVKLLVYDLPSEAVLSEAQDKLILKIAQDCREHDLPLFSEPIVLGEDIANNKTDRVIAAALRQQRLGATILKLEFPIDGVRNPEESAWHAACRDLSAAVSIPWVLLSAGVDFATFTKQLTVACTEGASGFMVGRALWGEGAEIKRRSERQRWFNEVARGRLLLLSGIAKHYGRPWPETFALPATRSDWFLEL